MENDPIARVIWKDITFVRTKEVGPEDDWNKLLLRWETIGRIKEKDRVLRICMEHPQCDGDIFETTNVPLVQLVPIENVELIELLQPMKENE